MEPRSKRAHAELLVIEGSKSSRPAYGTPYPTHGISPADQEGQGPPGQHMLHRLSDSQSMSMCLKALTLYYPGDCGGCHVGGGTGSSIPLHLCQAFLQFLPVTQHPLHRRHQVSGTKIGSPTLKVQRAREGLPITNSQCRRLEMVQSVTNRQPADWATPRLGTQTAYRARSISGTILV